MVLGPQQTYDRAIKPLKYGINDEVGEVLNEDVSVAIEIDEAVDMVDVSGEVEIDPNDNDKL